MANRLFGSVKLRRPSRNVFNLSHEVKLSFRMSELIPIYVEDVVPGDKFRVNAEIFLRMQPMLAPIMHRVNVFTHFFFVPYRLLWSDWENFITGGRTGTLNPVFPKYTLSDSGTVKVGTLFDYLGLPAGQTLPVGFSFSKMPFLAYQLIYDTYYRDQNLQTPVVEDVLPVSSGNTSITVSQLNAGICTNNYSLRSRAWEKDYFTSALPWAQRGGDVMLPLGGSAPVDVNLTSTGSKIGTLGGVTGTNNTSNLAYTTIQKATGTIPTSQQVSMSADLSGATSTTINELRRSIKLQEWLEKNARGGARYIEQIFSHFGVKSSDSRLQRPEFLGGGKTPVVISEVLQQSSAQVGSGTVPVMDTPLGTMAGHGVSVGNTHEFSRFFEEHGIIIGIMSVMPKTAYQQGIPRMFTKYDKFDYYFPEFAHLGEQAIKNKELYVSNDSVYNEGTFGYTPRYAEYKFRESRVCGDFRTTLDYWHLGRKFSSAPLLNTSFISPLPDIADRIFAVQDSNQDQLLSQVYLNIKAVRPMPKFGTPLI